MDYILLGIAIRSSHRSWLLANPQHRSPSSPPSSRYFLEDRGFSSTAAAFDAELKTKKWNASKKSNLSKTELSSVEGLLTKVTNGRSGHGVEPGPSRLKRNAIEDSSDDDMSYNPPKKIKRKHKAPVGRPRSSSSSDSSSSSSSPSSSASSSSASSSSSSSSYSSESSSSSSSSSSESESESDSESESAPKPTKKPKASSKDVDSDSEASSSSCSRPVVFERRLQAAANPKPLRR